MGWMAIGWILPVLIGALAWASLKNRPAPGKSAEAPEEIIRRRYASGEIDRDTYQRMLGDLKSG